MLSDLTDEQLLAIEEALYDQEVEGEDVWAERDEVLWEINSRKSLRLDASGATGTPQAIPMMMQVW